MEEGIMPRQWFNCRECGRTRANEFGECAYCGGDVVVMIDEKADMTQCPCCKGRGFVEKGADVHDVRPHGFRRFR
jgi:predicted ATP-dependent serine protease